MKRNLVFDAWSLVALLKAEEPAYRRVRALLLDARKGQINCFMTLINLGEVYYICGRHKGLSWANQKLAVLKAMPISFVPVDEGLITKAATYKMMHPISYADAFALVTAIERKAILVTGDREFNKLTHLVDVELLHRK